MNEEIERLGIVIAMINRKGGTGKSTTCLNAALYAHKQGYKVLIIDADPQLSSALAISMRIAEFGNDSSPEIIQQTVNLRTHVNNNRTKYDYIFIDNQGADSNVTRQAIGVADVAYVTYGNSGLDIAQLSHSVEMIMRSKDGENKELISLFLPTMVVKQRTAVNRESRAAVEATIQQALFDLGYEETPEELDMHLMQSEISFNVNYTKMDMGISVFEFPKKKTKKKESKDEEKIEPVHEFRNLLAETVAIINKSNDKEVA